MSRKSEYLQIRLTPREKADLKRRAAAAGQDVSTYVLSRTLPAARGRFEALLKLLAEGARQGYVLAALNDLLAGLAAAELVDAVAEADLARLSPFQRNYVAAMVEQAAHLKGARPPDWAARVEPLEEPWYATPMRSLRRHLVRASPVPFKRRNLFVDTSVGGRA